LKPKRGKKRGVGKRRWPELKEKNRKSGGPGARRGQTQWGM